MKNTTAGKVTSLVKICRNTFITISIVAIVFVLLIFFESKKTADRYASNTGEYTLELYGSLLDSQLANIYDYSYNLLQENSNAAFFATSTETAEKFQAKKALSQQLEEFISLYPSVGGGFFCYKGDSIVRTNETSFDESNQIREYLLDVVNSQENRGMFNTGWSWTEYESGRFCLLCMVRYQDFYCAAWINEKALNTMIGATENLNGQGFHIFFRQNGRDFPLGKEWDKNNVLMLSRTSRIGDFDICLELERYDRNIWRTIAVILTACILLIFFLILFFRRFSGTINGMVKELNKGLQMIGRDVTSRICEETDIQEVASVFSSLNQMADQVETLQLRVYQSRIEEQKSHIRFLQTQIKSHYYINCLNIIYSLAELENYELIQQFALNLVDYYRYMGNAFGQMAVLKDELGHIRNYIQIQQMRYPDRITYKDTVDPEAQGTQFLPLVLLTFVENIFKHAFNMKQRMEIELLAEAVRDEGTQLTRITIRDNGPGFPKEELEKLQWFIRNYPEVDNFSGRNSGMINTIIRLYMQYGQKVKLQIQNRAKGSGAEIILLIPEKGGEVLV